MGVLTAYLKASCLYASRPVRFALLHSGRPDELRGLSEDVSSDIMPLPDSSYTSPNFFVRLSPAAREALEAKGFIANPAEIENNREV